MTIGDGAVRRSKYLLLTFLPPEFSTRWDKANEKEKTLT
jgi:hypothetical protein